MNKIALLQENIMSLFYSIADNALEHGVMVTLDYLESPDSITLRCFRQDENESEVDKDS